MTNFEMVNIMGYVLLWFGFFACYYCFWNVCKGFYACAEGGLKGNISVVRNGVFGFIIVIFRNVFIRIFGQFFIKFFLLFFIHTLLLKPRNYNVCKFGNEFNNPAKNRSNYNKNKVDTKQQCCEENDRAIKFYKLLMGDKRRLIKKIVWEKQIGNYYNCKCSFPIYFAACERKVASTLWRMKMMFRLNEPCYCEHPKKQRKGCYTTQIKPHQSVIIPTYSEQDHKPVKRCTNVENAGCTHSISVDQFRILKCKINNSNANDNARIFAFGQGGIAA